MARLVALWRCQCGIRIKVVAEADSNRSARQMASCPKCRAPRSITADKIISVSEDTFDGRPAAVFCEEKDGLLVAQKKAWDVYTRLVSEVAEAAGTMAHAEFEFLADSKGRQTIFSRDSSTVERAHCEAWLLMVKSDSLCRALIPQSTKSALNSPG
jgi:hypothetical protein